MSQKNVDAVTQKVMDAVRQRLGTSDPAVVDVIAREVLSVMTTEASVPPRSTREPAPAVDAQATRPGGAMPRGGGATVPPGRGAAGSRPAAGEQSSLERCAHCMEQQARSRGSRAVVTTTGRNTRGVVATISAEIAAANGDIQDISQTLVGDYFTMIMVVDIASLSVDFAGFKERIQAAAARLGIHSVVMHEDVMRALQRV